MSTATDSLLGGIRTSVLSECAGYDAHDREQIDKRIDREGAEEIHLCGYYVTDGESPYPETLKGGTLWGSSGQMTIFRKWFDAWWFSKKSQLCAMAKGRVVWPYEIVELSDTERFYRFKRGPAHAKSSRFGVATVEHYNEN